MSCVGDVITDLETKRVGLQVNVATLTTLVDSLFKSSICAMGLPEEVVGLGAS